MDETGKGRGLDRLSTGIAGIDAVLGGGLLTRSVYLLAGRPGTGKTILANQVCFHQAEQGGRALYVTLLAEAHERMLGHLTQLRFFDASHIPDRLAYVSAYTPLAQSGIKGLCDLLSREARARRPAIIIIDGLLTVEEVAANAQELKRFIHELQTLCSLVGSTMLLLTSTLPDSAGPAPTMVDGVLEIGDRRVLNHPERELVVTKFRGSSYIKGGHAFQITDCGIVVHPRMEGLLQDPPVLDTLGTKRLSTGMRKLDESLRGGLLEGSSTVIFGPTGSGKTTLGLHFLDQSSAAEPGLHFGFYETPPRILFKGARLGLGLAEKQESGHLELLWHPTTERILDVLGHRLLSAVRARGVKRLFMDGIDGLIKAAADPDRIPHFLAALTNELRVLGVTTIFTIELQELFAERITLPIRGFSALIENALLLRLTESEGQLLRTLTVIKLRDSDYDGTIRTLRIAPHATDVTEATLLHDAEAARQVARWRSLRGLLRRTPPRS